MESVHEQDARIFKAFSDPKRLAILELLRGGEKCACVLMEKLDMGQSAVSYHMKILCQAGIVDSWQEGKWTHYCLSPTGGREAARRLVEITTPGEEDGCSCR